MFFVGFVTSCIGVNGFSSSSLTLQRFHFRTPAAVIRRKTTIKVPCNRSSHFFSSAESSLGQDVIKTESNRQRKKLNREFFTIAIPAFFQLAAEPLAGLVDTAYLGRLGPEVCKCIYVVRHVLNLFPLTLCLQMACLSGWSRSSDICTICCEQVVQRSIATNKHQPCRIRRWKGW